MKKTFAKIAAAIAVVAFIGVSCTEDDISNPTITLTGDASVYVQLGATFTDPGFTANDDKDGDITSQVTVTGLDNVNTSQVGVYQITYTVSDEAGNTTEESRSVYVKADNLQGTYSVALHITGTIALDTTVNETVTVSSDYNAININTFSGFATPSLIVKPTVNGTSIIFNQVVSYDWDDDGTSTNATIQGTTLSAYQVVSSSNSKIVTLSYTMDYGGGQIDNVTATYTKQ